MWVALACWLLDEWRWCFQTFQGLDPLYQFRVAIFGLRHHMFLGEVVGAVTGASRMVGHQPFVWSRRMQAYGVAFDAVLRWFVFLTFTKPHVGTVGSYTSAKWAGVALHHRRFQVALICPALPPFMSGGLFSCHHKWVQGVQDSNLRFRFWRPA